MHIYVYTWYHTLSITFIWRKNPATLFGFGWPHGPGRCAENGPWYKCIYPGGQMGKLTRVKSFRNIYVYINGFMQYQSLFTQKTLTLRRVSVLTGKGMVLRMGSITRAFTLVVKWEIYTYIYIYATHVTPDTFIFITFLRHFRLQTISTPFIPISTTFVKKFHILWDPH